MNLPVADVLGVVARKVKDLLPHGCKRVLLVNVPQTSVEDFVPSLARAGRNMCFPPYGLGLLSRGLNNAGYGADILDLNFEILSHVADATFRYNIWENIISKRVESFRPELIGLSCMFSMSHNSLKATAGYLKSHFPNVPIVAGGVHVSGNDRLILDQVKSIDLVLKYEADNAIISLVDYANNKIDESHLCQITMFEAGQYIQLDNRNIPTDNVLDRSPDYGLLPIGEYSSKGKIGAFSWLRLDRPKVGTILANRGCRGRCTYCSVANFNGKGIRGRAAKSVADELQYMYEHYGISHFMWLDDDLFSRNAIELFDEIASRNLKITWDASNGVIASATTSKIMHAAAESGCIGLAFGIESGDPEILRSVGKPSKVEHFLEVGKILKEFPDIFSKGNLMIGFPGETIGQIKKTIDLAIEIGFDWYTITSVSFLGGTEMTEKLIGEGKIDRSDVLSANFFVSPNGIRQKREKAEIQSSTFSPDIINEKNASRIPSTEELSDIWFLMDYELNFLPVCKETNPIKLGLKRLMFKDICERVNNHAMAKLFLGIVNQKLGYFSEAKNNFTEVQQSLDASAFWRVRFERLGMNNFLAAENCNR